jgi:AraC-like DNA-binding protein
VDEIISLFILFGSLQGFFLIIILIFKGEKKSSTIILSGFIFSLSFFLFLNYLSIKGYYFDLPHFIGLIFPLPFLHGPFIYLYIRLKVIDKKIKWSQIYHFLPFIISFLYYSGTFYFESAGYKLSYFEYIQSGNIVPGLMMLRAVQNIQSLIYSVVIIFILVKHENDAENIFSDLTDIELTLQKRFFLFLIIIWFLSNIIVVMGFVEFENSLIVNKYYFIILTSIIFFIFYIEFPGDHIPGNEKKIFNDLKDDKIYDTRYIKSKIDKDSSEKYSIQIMDYLEKTKSYKDPDLTIQSLSDAIAVSNNKISQVLNITLGVNFYNLINRYRIEEAKEIFNKERGNRIKILNVGFSVGFNSKSTFNSAFKKHTGLSPSEYIKNL